MPDTPAFRHDPAKFILPGAGGTSAYAWTREPAVCGYRRLEHDNRTLDRTIPVPVSASPAVVSGVGVVVASDDGRIRFFDRMLRKVYWERRLDSAVYASVVVDTRRDRIIVCSTNGLVTSFDLRGTLGWSAQLDVPIYATPTHLSDSDVLVVAAFTGRCIGLSVATGAVAFDRRLPEPWYAEFGGSAAHRDPYASPAATADDSVIVCCAEHVLCLAAEGTELWRHEIGHGVKASPVALHRTGEVAVCPVDGRCVFLDSRSGQQRSELVLGAKPIASPAVSGDVLAIGTQSDTVTAVDVRTRRVVWTVPHGAPRSYTSFSVLPSGDFIATSARGNIVCLGRADGRFRWESSQVLGLPDHEPEMDITPVAGPDGSMYCASYTGVVYHFRFQPIDGKDARCR